MKFDRRISRRSFLAAAGVSAAALALTACGNKTTEATPTPTPDLNAPATTPEEGMEIDPEAP